MVNRMTTPCVSSAYPAHGDCSSTAAVRVQALISIAMISACSSASAPPPEQEPDAGHVTPPGPDASKPMPDAAPTYKYLCSKPPPANAAQPLMPGLPSAGCPALQPGMNTMTSTGHNRDSDVATEAFKLEAVPDDAESPGGARRARLRKAARGAR